MHVDIVICILIISCLSTIEMQNMTLFDYNTHSYLFIVCIVKFLN